MSIRARTEEVERKTLSEFGCAAANSRGRRADEEPCAVRTCFQRDRDRIIHSCKSFRRLAYKTQCFIGRGQDHIRTRLTHTLEVSQIGRTVARALRLNEDLTEAIALGHDLGHTPFGHAGEGALDQALRELGFAEGFEHNKQSLRVVDVLERDGRGANLSYEVRNGIRYHRKRQGDLAPVLHDPNLATLEGQVIKWADRVAYINHDLDDALRAGIVELGDIPIAVLKVLGDRHSTRINTCVADLIEHSADRPHLGMSEGICDAANDLRQFLYSSVYRAGGRIGPQERRASAVVRQLLLCYLEGPDDAPFLTPEEASLPLEDRLQVTIDYVAGMTDRFASGAFAQLYVPDGFQ